MRRLLIVLTVTSVIATSAISAPLLPRTPRPVSAFGDPRAVVAILAAHDRFFTAYLNSDAALAERVLSKGFRFMSGDGRALERQAYIPQFLAEARTNEISDFGIDGVYVQVLDSSGVVSGRLSYELTRDGKRVRSGGRFVDIYVKEDGEWRVGYSSFFRDPR